MNPNKHLEYRATAFATAGACTKCTRYGWRRPWHRNRMEWKFGPFASIQTGIEIQGTLQKFLQWVSDELSSAIANPSQGKTITSGSTTRIITVHLVVPIAFACKEIQIWHVAWENLRVKVLQYVLKKGKEKLSKWEFCEFVTSFHHLKNCIQSASAWHTPTRSSWLQLGIPNADATAVASCGAGVGAASPLSRWYAAELPGEQFGS